MVRRDKIDLPIDPRITVTVPGRPARAGIDPRNLLIDVKPGDNLAPVSSR